MTETVEVEFAEKFIIYVSDEDFNVFCAKIFVGTVKELDDECDRIIAETNCKEYLHVLCYTDKRWEWVQKQYNQVSKSALSVVVRKTEAAEQETELDTDVETEQTAEQSRKTERETIKMTETMVNGMKFKVWNDTTRKATFAESEDGRVEKIHDCGYITADLTIRKAIAMVYGLPTFRKNAVKTASAVEETPVTESKEQEVETAEQTETKTETTTVETSEQTEETKDENTHIWVTKEAYLYLRDEMRKQRGFKPLTKEQKERMIIHITKNGMSNKIRLDHNSLKIRLDHNSLGGGDGTKDGRWWGWNVATLKKLLKKAGYSYET